MRGVVAAEYVTIGGVLHDPAASVSSIMVAGRTRTSATSWPSVRVISCLPATPCWLPAGAVTLRLLPWGIAPLLVARAGALADRHGERPLILTGSLLMAAGMGLFGLAAGPGVGYAELVAPMAIGSVGFALAVPAVTKSVVSLVAPKDLGKAAGTFSTTRQLGGAFGVAVLGAVFAGTGGYAIAQQFSDGYAPAMGAALLAAVAEFAAAALPGRRGQARAAGDRLGGRGRGVRNASSSSAL